MYVAGAWRTEGRVLVPAAGPGARMALVNGRCFESESTPLFDGRET